MRCPICNDPVPGASPQNDARVMNGQSVCTKTMCQELHSFYMSKLEEGDFVTQSERVMEAVDAAA